MQMKILMLFLSAIAEHQQPHTYTEMKLLMKMVYL